ncbi:hypothetical protein [Paenibacillus campi]|uniref:hypothetical protein n=1 Tax=Paenibacillus campi TaxID=3106031 RepID=UPI002AFDD5D7|nr:hypothetical protein [Paenibacillus sp. SGZ-1014]
MFKKLLFATLIGLLTLPLSVFASSVPEDVQENLQQNVSQWIPSLQRLTENSTTYNTQSLSDKEENQDHLGDGYAVYDIDLRRSATQSTYTAESDQDVLRFKGYMFIVEGQHGSKALAFAYSPPNYTEITRISSSENFSDADFKIPMAKAKQRIGFNATSKLLYDLAHQTIALVTTTDQGEHVALLQDSMLLGLKKYDVLSLHELIAKVRQVEAEQAQQASFTNEPTSGGGGGAVNSGGGTGNVQAATEMFTSKLFTSQAFIWIVAGIIVVGLGIVYYVVYRKRKQRSISH